jgi:hypothetical protein
MGEDVGEVVLSLAPIGDDLAVVVDPVIIVQCFEQLAVPFVPARWDVSRILLARVTI